MNTKTISPTHTRKTVYLSDVTINTLERRAKIYKKSFSKTLDEFVLENSSNKPKNNLFKWILQNVTKEEEKALDNRFERSDKDWNQSQKNIKNILNS